MVAGCVTEAFSTTYAVHIEDCEGWWLAGCRGSVAEHWRLKPEVSWVRLLVVFGLGTRLSDIRVKNFRVKAKFRLRA